MTLGEIISEPLSVGNCKRIAEKSRDPHAKKFLAFLFSVDCNSATDERQLDFEERINGQALFGGCWGHTVRYCLESNPILPMLNSTDGVCGSSWL